MSYNILTETAFFKVINDLGGKMKMEQIQEEYHQFVTQVIDLCHRTSESKEALHALVFAETELQYHPLLHPDTGCALGLYIKKALSFIRKMMQQVKASVGKGASVAVAVLIIRKLYSVLALSGVCWHCFWTTMGCVYTTQ